MSRKLFSRCSAWKRCVLIAVCLLLQEPARAELAQEPLLSRTVNVRPNIALVLDTSGSMEWSCVYAQYVTDLLVKERGVGARLPGLTDACETLTGDLPNLSPSTNLLHYSPYKTYGPGYIGGTRQPNAPILWNTGVVFYLPSKAPKDFSSYADIKNTQNYVRYLVDSSGFRKASGPVQSGNPLSHGGTRRDCVGTTCTLLEERQNIANWSKYHATRIAAAKTGLSAAFSGQPDNFRLAYGTIYDKSTAFSTMTNFNGSKAAFFQWLDRREPWEGNGTPLRSALQSVGEYYKDARNSGPWGNAPWSPSTSELPSNHLSCRRSYALMVTDGFYNVDDSFFVGDVDGAQQPTIKYPSDPKGAKSYTYTPGDEVDIRNTGKSDYFKRPGAASVPGGIANTLADVALKYWVTDLRPDLPNIASAGGPSNPPFWQNMTSYMVSFGAPGYMTDATVAQAKSGKVDWSVAVPDTITTIDNMRHAAHNGGGDFLTVTDAEQFSTEIGKLIGKITSQKLSQAGVAGSSPEVSLGIRIVRPLYMSGNWWGNLEQVELDEKGNDKRILWRVIDVDKDNAPTGKTLLPAPAQRNIVVWADEKKGAVAFNHANLSASSNGLMGINANVQMNASVSKEAIDFLRGDRSLEGTRFRSRLAVLGDIVNAQPVYVKNVFSDPQYEKLPAGSPGLSSYAAYIARKNARTEGVIFVGANDGMVHAFNEGSGSDASDGGRELFAYVPRSVLGKLDKLTSLGYRDEHTFTVDGPLVETDVYMGHGTVQAGWRNLVLGTTGAGAKAVFALDATQTLAMTGQSVLWEINPDPQFPAVAGNKATAFQELGHVLSPVQSGVTESGHWVSVFGNGYESKSGQASLFIVDSGTGALLKEIKTDTLSGNGLGAPGLVRNANRQIIGAYAGDLQGRLWKFNLSGQPSDWALANQGKPLFRATDTGIATGVPLPITWAPVATERADPVYPSSHMVSFATGKLLEKADLTTVMPMQAAFGLWDRLPFGSLLGNGSTDVQQIADSQLERVNLVDKTSQVKKPKPNKIYYGATYANATTKSIDWTSKRGWRLALDDPKTPGLRAGDSVAATGDVVLFNLVAPPTVDVSCDATEAKAAILSFDPINGLCRVGGSLDTDGDGVIDEKDDPSVCGLSVLSAGRRLLLRVPNSSGNGKVTVEARGPWDTDRFLVENGKPAKGVMSRSWRQIYPRGR